MATLSDDERDLVLIAKISALSDFSEMTKRSKHKDNKKRDHQKTFYLLVIEGQHVCRDTFRFAHKHKEHDLLLFVMVQCITV
jgi:hypothetical protein